MCMIELYTYTHNYNSVYLGSVIVPPAGTHSFQPSLWKHGIQTLSFSSSCQLLWAYLSPPFHRQMLEPYNPELGVTAKIMQCSTF